MFFFGSGRRAEGALARAEGKLVQMLKIRENMKRMTSSQTPLPARLPHSQPFIVPLSSIDKDEEEEQQEKGKYLSSQDSLLFSVGLGAPSGHSSRQPQECALLPCMLQA